jgi:endonuclease YncB( thermonuclease family)
VFRLSEHLLLKRCIFIACQLIPYWLPVALGADFSSPVVSVLDGDTIEVLHNHRAERIRLSGMDCSEKLQAW